VEQHFIIRGKGLKSDTRPGNVIINPNVTTPKNLTNEDIIVLKAIRDKVKG
jgi:DnaJ-class molecular chaperone